MTRGERIFWSNVNSTFTKMGMSHLDPANGAAVEIVDWCRRMRRRPTYARQRFLERQSPALLAYLEALNSNGSRLVWRTLEDRINQIVQTTDFKTFPFGRPWYVGIWLLLPELVAIGQLMLDKQAAANAPNPDLPPILAANRDDPGSGDGDGGGDKTGSAGTAAKPQYGKVMRLQLPVVAVVLNETERRIFDLPNDDEEEEPDPGDPGVIEGPDGPNGPQGPIGGNP